MAWPYSFHKEPKSPPAVKEEKYNEQRASTSQVQDVEERRETQE